MKPNSARLAKEFPLSVISLFAGTCNPGFLLTFNKEVSLCRYLQNTSEQGMSPWL